MRGDYAAWLAEQPLSTRTCEAYLAAVTAFVAWLEQHDAGPGDALVAPRARDLAARDYKRHMKVDRGLSVLPSSEADPLSAMAMSGLDVGLDDAPVSLSGYARQRPAVPHNRHYAVHSRA